MPCTQQPAEKGHPSQKSQCTREGSTTNHCPDPFPSMHRGVENDRGLYTLSRAAEDVDASDSIPIQRGARRHNLGSVWILGLQVLQELDVVGVRVVRREVSTVHSASCRKGFSSCTQHGLRGPLPAWTWKADSSTIETPRSSCMVTASMPAISSVNAST